MKFFNKLTEVFKNIADEDKQTAEDSIDNNVMWQKNRFMRATVEFSKIEDPIKLIYGQDFTTFVATLDYVAIRNFEDSKQKEGTVLFKTDGIELFNFWSEIDNTQDLVGMWIDRSDFEALKLAFDKR